MYKAKEYPVHSYKKKKKKEVPTTIHISSTIIHTVSYLQYLKRQSESDGNRKLGGGKWKVEAEVERKTI